MSSFNEEKQPRVYVLTRTSNRPKYFSLNRASVCSQTYSNIIHIVSADDKESQSYVADAANANSEKPLELITMERKQRLHAEHCPYDLYLNALIDRSIALGPGFIVVLDDDDVFTSKDAIAKAVSLAKQDSLLLWRVLIGERVIPPPTTNTMRVGYIDMNGFLLHNKWGKTFRFDDQTKAADYYFLKEVASRLPVIWSELVLAQTIWRERAQGLSGARHDMSANVEKPVESTEDSYEKDTIHIVVTTDKTYAPYCLTLFNSILHYNRENISKCALHLFARASDSDFGFLKALIEFCNRIQLSIRCYRLSGAVLLEANNPNYISKTTMDRLLIPDVLHESISNAIYIDVDMLVLCDLRDLLQEAGDCGSTGIAAVEDADGGFFTRNCAKQAALSVAEGCSCFNAGLLVLNLPTLRRENASKQWIDMAKMSGINDQVVLNLYCDGKYKQLASNYNYTPVYHKKIAFPTKIVHFAGPDKPWNQRSSMSQKATLLEHQVRIEEYYTANLSQKDNFAAFSDMWHWFNNDAAGHRSVLYQKMISINATVKNTSAFSNVIQKEKYSSVAQRHVPLRTLAQKKSHKNASVHIGPEPVRVSPLLGDVAFGKNVSHVKKLTIARAISMRQK